MNETVWRGFLDELTKIAEIPMSFLTAGSPMAQKLRQAATTVVKKPPVPPSVVTSAPPLTQLLKK